MVILPAIARKKLINALSAATTTLQRTAPTKQIKQSISVQSAMAHINHSVMTAKQGKQKQQNKPDFVSPWYGAKTRDNHHPGKPQSQ